MGLLAKSVVDIEPNLAPLSGGLGKAEGMLKNFSGKLSSLGTTLAIGAGVGGTALLAGGLLDAAKAASNLGEAVSKNKFTFGDSFGTVNATVQDLADRFGLVKTSSLDAAANLGLIAQAAGMTREQSAQLAVTFTRLAADAASFFNVPMEEALTRLQSGLVGEAEPMRRFGVLLSEDAVKQEALRMGLIKTTKEIDEQSKIAARASLILRGMATVSGDLERTQDSAANQMKKFQGDLENLKADFGRALTTPLTDAIKLIQEFGETLVKVTNLSSTDAAEGLGDYLDGYINGLRLINKSLRENGTLGAMGTAFAPTQDEVDKLIPSRGLTAPTQMEIEKARLASEAKQRGFLQAQEEERQAKLRALRAQSPDGMTDEDRRQKAIRDSLVFAAAARERGQADLQRRMWDAFGKPGSLVPTELGKDNPFAASGHMLGILSQGLTRTPGGLLGGMAVGAQALTVEEEKRQQEKDRRERLTGLAGVTDLLGAKSLAATAALGTKDKATDELKIANRTLDRMHDALTEFIRIAGTKREGAIVRGR